MSISDVTIPNDLDSLWMPFTDNRSFKKQPRLFSEAEGMPVSYTHLTLPTKA